jgi:hypothetical protein
MPSTGKRLNASWLWGFVLTTLVARRPFSFGPQLAELGEAADVYVRDPKVGAIASREEY